MFMYSWDREWDKCGGVLAVNGMVAPIPQELLRVGRGYVRELDPGDICRARYWYRNVNKKN
jgi:hypothetical protein